MNWSEVFVAFFACHLVGDFLLQTDWQARTKAGGLGRNPETRRALLTHVLTYTLCFTPALIWIGAELGTTKALLIAALIFLPHLVIDDRRLVLAWMRTVKGADSPASLELAGIAVAVDQAFHLICLFLTALLVSAL